MERATMIDSNRLLNWAFEERVQTYTQRDTILYALSVGLGGDPLDPLQLKFVYERDLVALPTMAMILGWPGLWFSDPATGIDAANVVNGGQELILHAPIPVAGTVRSQTRVTGLIDRGTGRGAIIQLERVVADQASGERMATVRTTLICRNNGGFGGPAGEAPAAPVFPERQPDHVVELPTLPQAHLMYRLNGDHHPLHVDPVFARSVGFERPILHGLGTFGIAGHALLKAVCGYEPRRLRGMGARFSAPFYPGELLSVEIWQDGAKVLYRAWVRARNAKVLDSGHATIDVAGTVSGDANTGAPTIPGGKS
jgi:acyl dehydratase